MFLVMMVKNDPVINTAIRINPATGDGFILLQSGNDLLATKLGSEWVFWQTGKIDRLTLYSAIDGMAKYSYLAGLLLCFVGCFLFGECAGVNSRSSERLPVNLYSAIIIDSYSV